MKKYRQRIVDEVLARKISYMGAVLVEGPKWCGKTTTCEQLAGSVLYIDDPDRHDQYLEMAGAKISELLEGNSPRLFDEWQDIPELWDAIRFTVDHHHDRHFILTGSAVVPEEKRKKIRHSGTGRFAWVRMRPMTLWESGESSGAVSLKSLMDGDPFSAAPSRKIELDEMAAIIWHQLRKLAMRHLISPETMWMQSRRVIFHGRMEFHAIRHAFGDCCGRMPDFRAHNQVWRLSEGIL